MNKQRFPRAVLLCLGLTVLIQLGCAKHNLKMGDFQKVALNPKNGDILSFEGFTATFRGENPCERKGDQLSECKLKIPGTYGFYQYDCDPACADPEIEVGSSTKGTKVALPASLVGPAPDQTVAMPCQNNKIALYPATTNIPVGQVVGWVRNGSGSQLLTKWKVEPNTFCEDTATPITETHSYCKAKTPGTYNYTVTSTATPAGCNPSNPGTIVIR